MISTQILLSIISFLIITLIGLLGYVWVENQKTLTKQQDVTTKHNMNVDNNLHKIELALTKLEHNHVALQQTITNIDKNLAMLENKVVNQGERIAVLESLLKT